MPTPKPVTVFGVTYPSFAALCRAHGRTDPGVRWRLANGMTLEQALTARKWMTGAKAHPSYGTWNSMRSRCYSKGNGGFRNYGAAGITMCDRWKNDFWAFVEDMGERPSKWHSIDRIDNSKGYSKENCRWATRIEQASNRVNRAGVESHKAKLSIQSVRAIRCLKGKITDTELAEAFGVAQATISRVGTFQSYIEDDLF